jgi:hypothetical protein
MHRVILLAVALLTAVWAADQIQGGPVLDPDGATTDSDGRNGLDPNGLVAPQGDGGNGLDPDG